MAYQTSFNFFDDNDPRIIKDSKEIPKKIPKDNLKSKASNTKSSQKETLTDTFASKLSPMAQSALTYMKAHPWMSAGLGVTGASNLAGLLDNSKVGGQLIGLGAGAGLGYKLLPMLIQNVSPQAKVLATLGGGTLGALFDSLRQKQEDEINNRVSKLEGGYY